MKKIINLTIEEFFTYTCRITSKYTNLNVDIWSKWCGMYLSKENKTPSIIIGKIDKEKEFIVSVTISEKPKIISQTPNISEEDMKEIEKGIEYVGRNYILFLKHYISKGLEYTDDDLIQDLKGNKKSG